MSPVVYLVLAVVCVAALALRWVPRGECLVVLRGRKARVAVGPRLTLVDPLRSHIARFSLEVFDVPLVVRTTTSDRHDVVVLATMSIRIADPATAAPTALDPTVAAARTVEEAAADAFATLTVPDLGRHLDLEDLIRHANLACARWGVQVLDLQVDEVDVRVVAR